MKSVKIQFVGLTLALYFIFRILPRVLNYPVLVVIGALYWPHISGRAKTAFMILGVFDCLRLVFIEVQILGELIVGAPANIPGWAVLPGLIIYCVWVYWFWFKVCRGAFSKVGLDRRISDIKGDLLLI